MAVNGGLSGYWSSCISIINFTSTPCIDYKTRKYHSYLEARISGYAFLNDKRYPCSVTRDKYNEQHIQEPWSQLPYYENLSTLTCVNKTCLCLTFRIQWMILNTPAMPWVWNLETSSVSLVECGWYALPRSSTGDLVLKFFELHSSPSKLLLMLSSIFIASNEVPLDYWVICWPIELTWCNHTCENPVHISL